MMIDDQIERPEDLSNELAPEVVATIEQVAREEGPAVDTTLLPPAEGRAEAARGNVRWNRDLPQMAQVAEHHVPADAELGSADCRVLTLVPEQHRPGAVVFVHGGGFAFLSPETHERCGRVLACESGLPVLMPDYRLAPEHPYPAGLRDVVATLRAALTSPERFGLAAGPVVVAGDSAGANLALAAMLHEHRLGRPLPDGGLLFYGVFGADFATPSYIRFADGPGLTRGKMMRYWDWYVPNPALRRDALVAPLLAGDAELGAMPPLHLIAAGVDPLLSDTLALARRLKALGRADPLAVVPGVMHGFLQQTLALGAARTALAEAGAAARRMIDSQ
jgi:acetyl esterase